jgi:APA family basic amino acid/polyamine antiporter
LFNGTLFAGIAMTFIASFVPFENLNDMISAGVLVAFSMTNSSLILLRHESPDSSPFLLEKMLTTYNVLALVTALLVTYCFTSVLGIVVTSLSCVVTLLSCVLMKAFCPEASFFGGKTRTTTQHMQVGVKPVEEEEYRTPMLPFVPCLGIFMNWYLIAQLSLTGMVMLVVFLAAAIAFYFSYGYVYSVGNNGGWEAFHWHQDQAEVGNVHYSIAEHGSENGSEMSFQQGLPIDDGGEDGDDEVPFFVPLRT